MSSPLYHHVKNVDIDEDREYPWVDRQKETDEKTDDTDDSNNNNLDSSDSTAVCFYAFCLNVWQKKVAKHAPSPIPTVHANR